jgi:hypothetical protein
MKWFNKEMTVGFIIGIFVMWLGYSLWLMLLDGL